MANDPEEQLLDDRPEHERPPESDLPGATDDARPPDDRLIEDAQADNRS